jgi:hypothetical protein
VSARSRLYRAEPRASRDQVGPICGQVKLKSFLGRRAGAAGANLGKGGAHRGARVRAHAGGPRPAQHTRQGLHLFKTRLLGTPARAQSIRTVARAARSAPTVVGLSRGLSVAAAAPI